jgi:hypothetical protein
MLSVMRPQLEAGFARYPGGLVLLNKLYADVKSSLDHGIEFIFFIGAIILSAAVLVNFFLKEIPLRGRTAATEVETAPQEII